MNEIPFLMELLKKCRIRAVLCVEAATLERVVDPHLCSILGASLRTDVTVEALLGGIAEHTKYILEDGLRMRYMMARLYEEGGLLVVGPYLAEPLGEGEVLEIAERAALSPMTRRTLYEYYATLPVISDRDRLPLTIDLLLERVWQTESFATVEVRGIGERIFAAAEHLSPHDELAEALANMERLERRYALENELIEAVTLGRLQMEKLLYTELRDGVFERRLQDPVRDVKNYSIIMNTLLRKAAERGGVHPLYVDRASAKFAAKIEALADAKAFPAMMREMFSGYCRLVRKHSARQYSAVVKNTVLVIDSGFTAELSLRLLAQRQGVTPEYLASVFKRETGKTVMQYLRDRRIGYAAHLLSTTNLQIQTVALHCGMPDVHHFSRLFKKQLGQTPREYRAAARAATRN